MGDWRSNVDQHKRVRRFNWFVISNEPRERRQRDRGSIGIVRYLPSLPELALALLLAATMTFSWFVLTGI